MLQWKTLLLGLVWFRMLAFSAVNFSHGQVGQSQLVNPDLAGE